jgi:hypothetical protein
MEEEEDRCMSYGEGDTCMEGCKEKDMEEDRCMYLHVTCIPLPIWGGGYMLPVSLVERPTNNISFSPHEQHQLLAAIAVSTSRSLLTL